MTRPLGDDPELHDAHLREALRHAPDAALGAPPALADAILQKARAAVHQAPARPAPPSPRSRLRDVWASAWAQLTRPPVAAAFASVMVATTLALLWRDGLMEEPFDPPSPVAAAPRPEVVPAATPPSPTPPRAADTAVTTQRAAPPPPAPPAKVAPKTARPLAAADAPAPGAAPPAPVPLAREQAAVRSAQREPPAGAPALPVAAAPLPAAAQTAPAPPAPPAAARDAAPALARSAAPLRERAEDRAFAVGKAAVALPTTSLAALPGVLQAEPERWTVQRGAAPPLPADNAVGLWLQTLAREAEAAGARWQGMSSDAAAPTAQRLTASADGPAGDELRLLRDGLPQHRFRLGADGVSWERAGVASVLALPPAALRRLADALPAAAPAPSPAAPR